MSRTCRSAGKFSEWLHVTEISLKTGEGVAEVPCGECTACCRSFMFIPIKPEETRTLQRIPRELLTPAPGLPEGYQLLGYLDNGECPMFVNNACSIYEDRPQTCRSYDCRVFTATDIPVDPRTQPDILDRVMEWVFTYESEESREDHRIVKEAAAFLLKNREQFPKGSLPDHPTQIAALAIRISGFFRTTAKDDLIQAILGTVQSL